MYLNIKKKEIYQNNIYQKEVGQLNYYMRSKKYSDDESLSRIFIFNKTHSKVQEKKLSKFNDNLLQIINKDYYNYQNTIRYLTSLNSSSLQEKNQADFQIKNKNAFEYISDVIIMTKKCFYFMIISEIALRMNLENINNDIYICTNKDGNTLLSLALEKGDYFLAYHLAKLGPEAALIKNLASQSVSFQKISEIAIKNDIEGYVKDDRHLKETDLNIHHWYNYWELMQFLIDNNDWKAILQEKNGQAPYPNLLNEAAKAGQLRVVTSLLEAGISDKDYSSPIEGNTALHWAVKNNDVQMLLTLIQAGANILLQNKAGQTSFEMTKTLSTKDEKYRSLYNIFKCIKEKEILDLNFDKKDAILNILKIKGYVNTYNKSNKRDVINEFNDNVEKIIENIKNLSDEQSINSEITKIAKEGLEFAFNRLQKGENSHYNMGSYFNSKSRQSNSSLQKIINVACHGSSDLFGISLEYSDQKTSFSESTFPFYNNSYNDEEVELHPMVSKAPYND